MYKKAVRQQGTFALSPKRLWTKKFFATEIIPFLLSYLAADTYMMQKWNVMKPEQMD